MSRNAIFAHKLLTAPEYIRALFEPEDNAAILVRNGGTGRAVQRIASARTIASSEFQGWLAVENARGSDIYVGMNPIRDGTYGRTKENIREILHVYLDLDERADQALAATRSSIEVPPPNFVLDTSPGKHQVVWRVVGLDQQQAESLLRTLANQFGGDPAATDSTRVLRLPGFVNRKYRTQEFVVQAHHESNQIYHARDFLLQEDSPDTPRHLDHSDPVRRSIPSGHKSQSEQDWAYAKRALARGDDPEQVIRRIADYRADDKSDPEYYARLTVNKAQAELLQATKAHEETPSRFGVRSKGEIAATATKTASIPDRS